jgi:hypothetical protein
MSNFSDEEREAQERDARPRADAERQNYSDARYIDEDEYYDEAHDRNERRNTARRVLLGLSALCLVALAVIGVIGLSGYDLNGSDTATKTVTATPSPTSALPSVQAAPTDCPNSLPLNFNPNVPVSGDLVPKNVNNPDQHAVETSQQVLQAIKNDPRVALGAGQLLFPADYPKDTDWHKFVDATGKCTSLAGTELVDKVVGVLTQKGTTVNENATADPNLVNTFLGANGVMSNATPGITGDLRAVEYTLPNGQKVTFLKRCGNLATPAPSSPVGSPPETEVPPPGTETVPPTTETPPPCTDCSCDNTCVTTTTTTPTTPPPCVPPPGNTQCMPPKVPTTNPSKPPGIVPLPLNPRDTLQPTRPTLAPGTTRQTTPIPTAAPPTHLNVTPRSAPPPPPAAKLPSPSQAPTSTIITRPHM